MLYSSRLGFKFIDTEIAYNGTTGSGYLQNVGGGSDPMMVTYSAPTEAPSALAADVALGGINFVKADPATDVNIEIIPSFITPGGTLEYGVGFQIVV